MTMPIECPHGCGRTLELDVTKTHQHIRCHECGCQFCAVCVDLLTIEEEEERLQSRSFLDYPMNKAHLN